MADLRDLARRYIHSLLEDGYALVGADPGRLWLAKENLRVVVAMADDAGDQATAPAPGLANAGLVVFGGDPGPLEPNAFFLAYRVDLDGGVDPGPQAKIPWASRLADLHDLPAVDPETFSARLAREAQAAEGRGKEHARFAQLLAGRRPVVTWALLGVMGLFFALELLWGGAELTPTLVRMGALLRWPALDGQWWRLASSMFLHGGVMHIAFNGYVLFAIGLSIERILGSRRFLALFAASGFGGGLASAFLLSEGFSVGASGAIWGLLGAQGALAVRPDGRLPEVVLPGLKKAAMINLGINVLNSFRPQVDWAAHFGGGAVGALLIFTGVLTLGLPRVVDPDAPPVDRPPAYLWPLTVTLGAAMLVGAVLGPYFGQPWALSVPPALAAVHIDPAGAQVDLPTGLSEGEIEVDSQGELRVLGDILADPALLEVYVGRHAETIPSFALDAEMKRLAEALQKNLPPGSAAIGPPTLAVEGDRRIWSVAYTTKNGFVFERAAVLTPQLVARLDMLAWSDLVANGWRGLPGRLVRTATTTSR